MIHKFLNERCFSDMMRIVNDRHFTGSDALSEIFNLVSLFKKFENVKHYAKNNFSKDKKSGSFIPRGLQARPFCPVCPPLCAQQSQWHMNRSARWLLCGTCPALCPR